MFSRDPYLAFKGACKSGFSLIEVLLSSVVLTLILGLIMTVINHTSSTIGHAAKMADAFGSGRAAFDLVTQRLGQATLNTYMDYYDANGNLRDPQSSDSFVPQTFGRASGLHFLTRKNTTSGYGGEIFFQVPEAYSADDTMMSTQGLLNACGYFVRYGSDALFRPPTVTSVPERHRYYLMEALQPAENLMVYHSNTTGDTDNSSWTSALTDLSGTAGIAHPIAENVIAFIVWPRLSPIADTDGTTLTTDYTYDSRQKGLYSGTLPLTYAQMPPTVQVTMIMIDETSAARLDQTTGVEPSVIHDLLQGRFVKVSDYQKDLDAVVDGLAKSRIRYQVFNTSVVIRESKWSNR